jgi:hypothetical protein
MLRLLENVANVSCGEITAVHGDGRAPRRIVLVNEVAVASLRAAYSEACTLEHREHLPRCDLRQVGHARASFTGTISLTVV